MDAHDVEVSKGQQDKRAEVTKIVAEMTSLVQQTAAFDKAQSEGHKEAEAAADTEGEYLSVEAQEDPVRENISPNKVRPRFNYLVVL